MLAADGHDVNCVDSVDSDGDSDADVSGSLNMSRQVLQCLCDVYVCMCWTHTLLMSRRPRVIPLLVILM